MTPTYTSQPAQQNIVANLTSPINHVNQNLSF